MARLAPSERFRRELDEALEAVDEHVDPNRDGRPAGRLVDLAAGAEDSRFLGRARYERGEEPVAHRNGYEPRAVKTASGVVELQRPRIRNAEALGFESLVLGKGVTHALESLSGLLVPARAVGA
jgi:Transposase, Mutator family